MRNIKNSLSKYAIAFSLIIVALLIMSTKSWRNEKGVIAMDVVSYYAYLPATFIFHDIELENKESFENGIFWPEPLPDGNQVIKTTMGMSILYSPFFFVAHAVASLSGHNTYGYSSIYKIGLLLSSLFFLFIGLLYLRRILKIYFSEKIVALVIVTVTLGTNLLNYASYDACMTHVYNFALINVFIWYTIKWYENQRLYSLLFLGLLSGLITLIRPSNIIVLVFFFLYGVSSIKTLVQRMRLVLEKFHWFVFMAFAFVLMWVPQFFYWWHVTGNFIVDSYPDEQFYWGNPHIISGLFSYRKGWLVYTPVMIFALVGIPLLFKKMKEFSWAVLVFMVLSVYIIVSWWCWWYGGSFGMRSFVDYYGLLAIPLALFFTEIWKLRKHFKFVVYSIVLLAVLQNNYFLEKYKRNSLHYDATTKASFWHSFWHFRPQSGYWELLESPDYSKALEGIDAIKQED